MGGSSRFARSEIARKPVPRTSPKDAFPRGAPTLVQWISLRSSSVSTIAEAAIRSTSPSALRTCAMYSFDSPFDHFIAGDKHAIDDAAKRGWELFNTRGRCNKCHALTETRRDVMFFTDNTFHNIGVSFVGAHVVALVPKAERLIETGDTVAIDRAAIQMDMSALGRFLISKADSDIAAFKTPDLRNVLVTEPYFHDGSAATLWDVV